MPGAYEVPQAARTAAATGRYDAVVCLGCLIRGETPHFEYISEAVAHGIMAASADTGVPMSFGVLTTNSAEQALERAVPGSANKGWEAAMAAVEMATLAPRRCAPDRWRDAVKTGPRHHAREAALQMLYQWEVGRVAPEEAVSRHWEIEQDGPGAVRRGAARFAERPGRRGPSTHLAVDRRAHRARTRSTGGSSGWRSSIA